MDEITLEINEIYERYYRDVYQFALFYTNSKQEAEDITQETFIKIMKSISSLQNSQKLKTWILSIARNTAVDLHRKRKFVSLFPEWMLDQGSNHVTPEDHMIQKDDWEELQRGLLKLKQQYRAVLILRGLKELSIQETSEILGCSESKVRVDYHRAVQQLKKHVFSSEEGWEMKDGQS